MSGAAQYELKTVAFRRSSRRERLPCSSVVAQKGCRSSMLLKHADAMKQRESISSCEDAVRVACDTHGASDQWCGRIPGLECCSRAEYLHASYVLSEPAGDRARSA